MKRQNLVVFTLVMAFVFVSMACVSTATAAPKKTVIKLAHTGTTDHNFHKGAVKFALLVKERSKGAVEVQVFPNGMLGAEKDLIEQARQNIIQMMLCAGTTLTMIHGWEPLTAAYLPYVLKQNTEDAQQKTLDRIFQMPFMQKMSEDAAKVSGLRAIDLNWFYGMRHVTTKNKEIRKPEDMIGLKTRTMDSPLARSWMSSLGASATPMSFPEVYTSLQMGVIDAQENPPSTVEMAKLYEVQKNLALTGHTTMSMALVINDQFFKGLSPEIRAIIIQADKDANAYQTDLQLKANSGAIDKLKQKGMKVTTVDRAAFAAKARVSWKEFEPQIGKDFYTKFLNAQN